MTAVIVAPNNIVGRFYSGEVIDNPEAEFGVELPRLLGLGVIKPIPDCMTAADFFRQLEQQGSPDSTSMRHFPNHVLNRDG
jgi:hypothetical protein